MSTRSLRSLARPVAALAVGLVLGTLSVAILERAGIDDASTAYLLAVVAVAVLAGTWPAVVTAVGGFVLYDALFVEPRYTLTVEDPQEWLNLVLLLAVGVVVGQLAGRERDRAETALAREREAQAMFRIGFAIARAPDAPTALPAIVDIVHDAVDSERVWVEVADRVVADTGQGDRPARAIHDVLRRQPGDRPAAWTRVHAPAPSPRRVGTEARSGDDEPGGGEPASNRLFRVTIAAADRVLGAVVVQRAQRDGPPDGGETRVLAAAADEVGRALERDRLVADAAAADVARRSDALKSALLDSVSHDLRTPLASIRASAGTLMAQDPEGSVEERRVIAGSIDLEAERLDRLVQNLLDMSRIEAGGIQPRTSAFILGDLVERAVSRSSNDRSAGPTIDIPMDLPPVEVDDVLFDLVLTNLFDNGVRHAGPEAPMRISASQRDGVVAMTVEDGGPGVPEASLVRLFDKFYRVPRAGEGARRGTGTGLAVVRGMMEAMGGSVSARRSDLGGLAIDVVVPMAPGPMAGDGTVSGP